MENKEVAVLKGQITKLETQVLNINVTTPAEYEVAIDIVSKLKSAASALKDAKEKITKPLNEALNQARGLFAPAEEQYENAERVIKGKLLDYKRKVDAEAKAKEDKIAADLESGKIKKVETAERKIENIERVETTTHGKVGSVQIKKVKKVRIINEADIPRQYLVPDMILIRKDALAGVAITGVEVYEEDQVAAR